MKKSKAKVEGDEPTPKLKVQRTYQERLCLNTIYCLSGGKYIPKDKRQAYCCPKCGENFRNDLRNARNNKEFANEKELRKMDKGMGKLFVHFEINGIAVVWQEFFKYEKIDLTMSVFEQVNAVSNQPVRWFYQYGVERHPSKKDYFIIYKRKI